LGLSPGSLPPRILDAHTHVAEPAHRLVTMSEAKRKQYWVNELLEPIDASTAERCYRTVFPNRQVTCLAFGMPDLDYDLDANNSSGQGGADFATTFTEDLGPVAIADVDATLLDVDDPNLTALTVTITNQLDGASEVLAADTTGTSITARRR
jgi:hypothetical protein